MLKPFVTDINEVEENLRGVYKQDGDKFILQVAAQDGFELADVKGLRSALGAERNIKSQLETSLKQFEGIDAKTARQAMEALTAFDGITPDAAREAIETAKRLSEIDPAKEADRLAEEKATAKLTPLQAQWKLKETELTSQIGQLDATTKSLTTQLEGLLVGNSIKTELAALNPVDDARDAIELLASRSVKTTVVDGKFVVQVLDDNGHPRIKDAAGTPFTVSDLLAELKEQRPGLFKADPITGLGSHPTKGAPQNSSVVNPWMKDTLNLTQQAILKNTNPTLAKTLMAQAGVK